MDKNKPASSSDSQEQIKENIQDRDGISRRDFLAGASVLSGALLIGSNRSAEAKESKQSSNNSPKTLLVKNATVVVTMNGARDEIKDGGVYVENGFIKAVGKSADLPSKADEVIDLRDHILLPGLVNTHHHLYQHLTRVVPETQDGNVWNWLKVLYPLWAKMTPEMNRVAIQAGLAELALSGCTTGFDHQYVFPNGCNLDECIATARDFGMRFHAARGSMSLGHSKGGLPPDSCVEDENSILKDSQRVIDKYHDLSKGSMTQIVLGPCSPFSVTEDLMVESAKLARKHKVKLHTHLAESLDEERYTMEKFNVRPVGLMEKFGWLGDDVWFAHSVHINDEEIQKYKTTGSGFAHCPSSNMRLASGIAPVKKCRDAGVKVGLGVDGSSSNDSSHLLLEARMAMLLARTLLSETPGGPPADKKEWLSARDALEIATIGGARILGRDDIGSLEPGKCADFFAIDLRTIGYTGGAMSDPVASSIFCAPQHAAYTVINGRVIVRKGELTTIDREKVMDDCTRLSKKMIEG